MKMISANKLNRLWKNGVVAKMIAKTTVLKTMEEISANTSAENVAGATAVKELSNNLNSHPQFIYDDEGRITGYKTKAGADTVFPFNEDVKKVYQSGWVGTQTFNHTYTANKDGRYIIFMHCSTATGGATYKLNVSNAEEIFNKSQDRGACAVYIADLKKDKSIKLSYSNSGTAANSFAGFIFRC